MKKRMLSILLIVILLVSVLPQKSLVIKAEGYTITVEEGETYRFTSDEEVCIEHSGEALCDVDSIKWSSSYCMLKDDAVLCISPDHPLEIRVRSGKLILKINEKINSKKIIYDIVTIKPGETYKFTNYNEGTIGIDYTGKAICNISDADYGTQVAQEWRTDTTKYDGVNKKTHYIRGNRFFEISVIEGELKFEIDNRIKCEKVNYEAVKVIVLSGQETCSFTNMLSNEYTLSFIHYNSTGRRYEINASGKTTATYLDDNENNCGYTYVGKTLKFDNYEGVTILYLNHDKYSNSEIEASPNTLDEEKMVYHPFYLNTEKIEVGVGDEYRVCVESNIPNYQFDLKPNIWCARTKEDSRYIHIEDGVISAEKEGEVWLSYYDSEHRCDVGEGADRNYPVKAIKHTNGAITVQTPLKNSITTRDLFEKYPEYLYESPQQKVTEMILEDCEDVNGNRTWAQNMQSGYKYMLSGNSINSILKLGASELGGTSIQDEYLDEATLRFLKEIMQQSDIVESTIKEVKKDYKWAKELETKTKELSSMEIQKLLAKSGHYSDKEIGLLIKKIGENWKEIDKVFKNVGYAIDMSEAALLIVTLESVQKSLIKNLLEEVKRTAPGSDVERGLTRALEQASHPYKTVVDKYLQKGCLQAIAKTVEKKGESLVELVVGTGSAGLVFCAESACKVIAYILPESSADDVINAQNDTNFFRVLNTCVSRKTRDFIYNKQNEGDLNIDEEISNYKLLYKAELAAAKNACNSCEKIAKNHMKNIIGNDSVFLNEFSYEKHIKGCKAKVNAMLNAKYIYKRFEDELSVNGLVEENKISETSLRNAVYSDEDELMETDDVVDNGILTIPNTTEGMSVISISDNAFKHNTEIECVIVPDGVKKIGKAAFKNCSSLKRVVLGDSVEKIDEEAFAGCSSLEIVFCPDSLQQIETNAIDNSTVTLMGTESSVAIEYAKKNNISYAITEKQVSSISISKMPEKTEYSAGEKLNETDMQLCVTFMDGTETIVTEGWYSFAYKDVNGNNKVHVTYGGASTEYQISIVSEQGIYEVICEDENGVDVADSLTYTAVVGETIGVSAPNVDGYEVISTEAKKDIWVKEDITKVVFQYRRCDTNNLKNAILKMTSDTFEYTGTEIIPDVVVTLNGRELVDGTDYERIALNNVDVGTGIMIISGIGNYDGIFIKEYEITRKKDSFPEQTMKPESNESVVELVQKPSNVAEPMVVNKDKKRTISKVKGFSAKNKKRKRIVLKWKKVSEAQGYQIQYTTKKKASKQKVKNTKKTKYVLTKLKNKVYYVRVRAYRMENGKKIYSQWSVIKKIRVKK